MFSVIFISFPLAIKTKLELCSYFKNWSFNTIIDENNVIGSQSEIIIINARAIIIIIHALVKVSLWRRFEE